MGSVYRSVPIDQIVIPEGRRPVRDVASLASSIGESGLLNPVTLTEDLRLIAGRNRLEACKSLGWTHVAATVSQLNGLQAELAEIDENLIRNELTALERGEQLKRRKEIYEAIHPETRHGGDRRSKEAKSSPQSDDLISFAKDTATKTGVSEATIEREVKIAKDIAEPVKAIVRDTPVSDNKTALLNIARQPVEKQAEVAREEVKKAVAPKPRKPRQKTPAKVIAAVAASNPAPAPSPPVVPPNPADPAPEIPVQLRSKLTGNLSQIHRDIKLYEGTRDLLQELKERTLSIVGVCSAAWMGPFQTAIFNLVHVNPMTWEPCKKCGGTNASTCTKCNSAGYQIPNL